MVGVSGIREEPEHPAIRTTPLNASKEEERIQPRNSRLLKPTPFKGNLKTEDKKINKIFQLKKKEKTSNENVFVCPHQCQVAILEECPKAGRGVRLVYEVQLSSFPVTVKLDSRTSWFMVTHGCRGGLQSSPAPWAPQWSQCSRWHFPWRPL